MKSDRAQHAHGARFFGAPLRVGFCFAITVILTLVTCVQAVDPSSQTASAKGVNTMTENELVAALRRFSPSQKAELDALAKTVSKDSRALARAATARLSDSDPVLASNALSLLIDIEDLATVPLLEAPEPPDAYGRVARMTIVVDGQLEVRTLILGRLKKMLGDKRPMDYKRMPRMEEAPPQSRVCDEAYVLLRRLLNTTEDTNTQMTNTRLFLRLPEARRDAEIHKAGDLKAWADFASGLE